MEIFASIFVNQTNFCGLQVDVSNAFIQSHHLHPNGRLLAVLPPLIGLEGSSWTGLIATSHQLTQFESGKAPSEGDEELRSKFKQMHSGIKSMALSHALLLFRPLYGSRSAPLRWYITVSSVLRKFGFAPLKTDHCVFVRHSKVASCPRPLNIAGRRVSALIYCMSMILFPYGQKKNDEISVVA